MKNFNFKSFLINRECEKYLIIKLQKINFIFNILFNTRYYYKIFYEKKYIKIFFINKM